MINSLKKFFILLSFTFICSCSKKIVPTSLNNSSLKIPLKQKTIMKSLNTSVEKIVNAGGNLKRARSIIKRIKKLDLSKNVSKETIDWFTFQKNILIEIKGESNTIVLHSSSL